MKRIRVDALEPGDIVLTASRTSTGKGIRRLTGGTVSHAMICVQHGSVIDSTAQGVQARNVQRELFKPNEGVHAFRLREPLDHEDLQRVVNFARSEIGTRYSKREAARSVVAGSRPRNRRQFCSRLVARAYAHVGVPLAADEDYCTPDELRLSPLLRELDDVTETVDEAELAAWRTRPNPIAMMHATHNAILDGVRALDPAVEHFGDVDRLVREHPEWDHAIAELFRTSGYLDIWRTDFEVNPWHYDVAAMEAVAAAGHRDAIHAFCLAVSAEAVTGGSRYRTMLEHYRTSQRLAPRQTTHQLFQLYEQLVRNDDHLRATAQRWLQVHNRERSDADGG